MVRGTGTVVRGTGAVAKGTGPVVRGTGAVVRGTGAVVRGTGAVVTGTGAVVRDTALYFYMISYGTSPCYHWRCIQLNILQDGGKMYLQLMSGSVWSITTPYTRLHICTHTPHRERYRQTHTPSTHTYHTSTHHTNTHHTHTYTYIHIYTTYTHIYIYIYTPPYTYINTSIRN